MYDIVISGAGPSGSHCAKILAETGYRVALIEKDTNWRKPCGGAVSSKIIRLYPEIKKLKTPKIVGAKLYSADDHCLEYNRTGDLYSTIVDRLTFDSLFRNIAIDAGAELFDKNLSYNFISKEGKLVGIKTKSSEGVKEYFGKILILADGMSSKLAIKSGLRSKWKVEDIGICKVAIMEGENRLDENYINIYFQHYKGYAWIFPMGNKQFNIGCGTFADANQKYNINEIFNEFLKKPAIKEIIPDLNCKVIWSGNYPLPAQGVLKNSLFANNLMLIGDTAGFVSPLNGEGIYQSIFSATAAAEVAIEALEQQDYSKNILRKFKKHPIVKQIVRDFKAKLAAREYFYEDQGKKLDEMFERAEMDKMYRDKILGIFFSRR